MYIYIQFRIGIFKNLTKTKIQYECVPICLLPPDTKQQMHTFM